MEEKQIVEKILLEAKLCHQYVPQPTSNPFKRKKKKKIKTGTTQEVGTVHLVVKGEETSPESSYVLRFIDVVVPNEKRLQLYVHISRNTIEMEGKSLKEFEGNAEVILLDNGPEGQFKGCQMPSSFEQEIGVFDPHEFVSIAICKPAAAKPSSIFPLVQAYGNFIPYIPPQKSEEEIAMEMEKLTAKLMNTVMVMEQDQLRDQDLDIEALKKNAHQLFKMFDQDGSDSISFDEFKQMLAYRNIQILESKAMRFFQLVDDRKKGYIDEAEFVAALYVTNYLRLKIKKMPTSPVDAFFQFDEDRDGQLSFFEFEKALLLLNVSADKSLKLKHFPKKKAYITIDQFKEAWLELVDVKEELRKRGVDPMIPYTVITSSSSPPSPSSSSSSSSSLFRMNLFGKKQEKFRHRLQLLDAINQEEIEEIQEALKAKTKVQEIERLKREEEQNLRRQLLHLKCKMEITTRTEEALKERQEKIIRRRERYIREKQLKEEKKLLLKAQKQLEIRKKHEQKVVQELMKSKIDHAIKRRAKAGDDILDLSCQDIKKFPFDLYHGKDAIYTLSNLLILNLSRNRLDKLPSELFYHLVTLQQLDLSENQFVTLPEDIGQLSDLRNLRLQMNLLETIPSQIRGLRHLETLDLSFNRLRQFGDGCEGLEALEELNLMNNSLEQLTASFGKLKSLRLLKLRGNRHLVLGEHLNELKTLCTFDLTACDIKRFGQEIGGQKELRCLLLSQNFLVALPEGIGQLVNLQQLDVHTNQLMTFPSSCIGNLKELVFFNAAKNFIEQIPEEIGNLKNLQVLNLAQNRLQKIPSSFGLLFSLQKLFLQSNLISLIPIEIGALENLMELNLSRNCITFLPEEIGCLYGLEKIDLSENKIIKFPDSIVMWQKLKILNCRGNLITEPLTSCLEQLQALEFVDFSKNRLHKMDTIFCKLKQLQVLNLSENNISYLPKEINQMKQLKKLDLYNNRLAALPLQIADILNGLDYIGLGRNPLDQLPEKWSDKWRLSDQYKTAFSHGYTEAEVISWIEDQKNCYPTIVAVWRQNNNHTSPAQNSVFVSAREITVEEFVDQVRSCMQGQWQIRYERIVRSSYYDFKHLGHDIPLEEISSDEKKLHDRVTKQLSEMHAARAQEAIDQDNAFRECLKEAYKVDIEAEMELSIKRRRDHEKKLLQELRQETAKYNAFLGDKVAETIRLKEEREKKRNADFAYEMKRQAQEKEQARMLKKHCTNQKSTNLPVTITVNLDSNVRIELNE